MRLLERTGDYWEMHIARYQIAASLYRLGDLRGALEEAQRMHKSGLELGDEQASGISLDVWALATRGMVPKEVLEQEVNRPRLDVQGKAQVLLAQGVQLTASGDHERAVAAFEQALREGGRLGLPNAYIAPNLAWLTTALRRQAESVIDLTPARRARLLERAEVAARRALRVARRLQNDLPHALREYALVRAMRNKTERLRALLDRSLAVARRQHARYEYAQSLLACGRLGRELGWRDADEQVGAAEALLHELTIPAESAAAGERAGGQRETLSLADRFDTVLTAGHEIASALSAATIREEARAAAHPSVARGALPAVGHASGVRSSGDRPAGRRDRHGRQSGPGRPRAGHPAGRGVRRGNRSRRKRFRLGDRRALGPVRAVVCPRRPRRLPLRHARARARAVRAGRRAIGRLHRDHRRRGPGKRRGIRRVAGTQRDVGAARGRTHRRRRSPRRELAALEPGTGPRSRRTPPDRRTVAHGQAGRRGGQ